ncbi:MAG: transporter substrate-binding domain-containing protein [Colwellia sp.]|nr:transporter substrate-binding domain-containing protein [Colwellia sp.]
MKLKIAFFWLLTCVVSHSTPLLSAEQSQDPSGTLTVVASIDYLPFSFSLPDGTPSGLYVEFWELWSKTNNIPIRILLVPFEESLQLVRQKNTLHVGLFRNEQREQWADFSLPIHNVQTGIIYNRSVNKNTKLSELKDIKVSTSRFSFQELYIREKYPNIEQLTYITFDDVLNQLLNNEVQAVIVELPTAFAKLAKKGLSGVFVISEEVIISNNVSALIAKGQPELLNKVNAGIENIPVNKIIELEKKWLPTLKPFFNNDSSLTSLTSAERKWLQQAPTLRLGVDSWYPYEYFNDEGDFSGISADYINYITSIVSLTIEVDRNYSWAEALAAMKDNKVDIMSAIVRTTEREKTMLFTEPYVSTDTILVSRKNGFNANSLASLKGRSIGMVAENAVLKFVAADFPELVIIPVDSTVDGLEKLNDGKFDAFLGDISFVNFTINKEQFSDLIITGFSPYKLEISMAVRNELAPLVGILNKVFLNMSEKKKVAIANDWLSIRLTTGAELSTIALWVLPIASFIMLIVILVFFRMNKKLKIEMNGRKKSEKVQAMLAAQLHQSQKMEALGKLTGGIAHDFNNMLGVIIGYSELLKAKLINDKKLTSYVDHISEAGERGAKLTKKLLSFTRKKDIESTRVDINELLLHQHDVLQKTLTVRIKITLKLCEDIWPIWLETSDLEDAILNMSINAMHAMTDNLPTAKLILKTDNVVITKDYGEELGLAPGNYVKLCIIDNGSGMSKDISKKIFDPFFSTKGKQGTGLGLSQVFGFVQRSSGCIIVKSSFEQGSHFTLYFPKYFVELEDVSIQLKESAINLKGNETILIVDDELALRKLATELLQREGYNILVSDSGESALITLEKKHVDLVLTDVLMPRIDGYQLAVKIKEKYPDMKIKLVSGFDDEKNNSFVDDDLQRNIIHKPYTRIELLQGVRTLLDS